MQTKYLLISLVLNFLTLQASWADSFDHGIWNDLVVAHVSPVNDGVATVVDYQGMLQDRGRLQRYLSAQAKISQAQFDSWSSNEQLAFLINAYNASTVELVLTAWPNLKSIKDLGGFLSSPWSKEFVSLLGKTRSLDDIEHKLIRGSGVYNDPRIHFAVNCASIGCPALRPEAFVGDRLDEQLSEQTGLFLMDRSRNRVAADVIELSAIFKWYREDFEKGWLGYRSLEDFLTAYASALDLKGTMVKKLKTRDADIEFLDYDWQLNGGD